MICNKLINVSSNHNNIFGKNLSIFQIHKSDKLHDIIALLKLPKHNISKLQNIRVKENSYNEFLEKFGRVFKAIFVYKKRKLQP